MKRYVHNGVLQIILINFIGAKPPLASWLGALYVRVCVVRPASPHNALHSPSDSINLNLHYKSDIATKNNIHQLASSLGLPIIMACYAVLFLPAHIIHLTW